jgi:argininosuccinate lyase
MHALPLTYNKDLQEDKEHLFDAVDTLSLSLRAAAGMLRGATFRPERMAAAASDELIAATDLADLLVKQGTPFREAHGVIAGLVREAVESGRSLAEVAVPKLGPEAEDVLAQRSWLESKASEGGTALARVREQLERAKGLL